MLEELKSMNSTIQLLQFIDDSSASKKPHSPNQQEVINMSQYSEKNRMLFFYLETLKKRGMLGDFSSVYEKENMRRLKTEATIGRLSRILTDNCIRHAIFKTIRPYKSTTVDLDILVFGNRDYAKSIEAMQDAGYRLVVRGPRSTTLLDQEENIGIDLYEQVAVSFVSYMDKSKLFDYVGSVKLPNGEFVKVLKPEADLACIIAHSILKEQMYTLSEYYTFIHYLKQMNIQNFLQVVKQNNITRATRTHASITALLHAVAHSTVPRKLEQLINELGEDKIETTSIVKKNFDMPHKYHPITLGRCLLELIKGEKTRKDIAAQILHLSDPRFSNEVFTKMIQHIKRKTY